MENHKNRIIIPARFDPLSHITEEKVYQIVAWGYTFYGNHRVTAYSDCIYGTKGAAEQDIAEFKRRWCHPLGDRDYSYLDEKTIVIEITELNFKADI